MPIGVPRIIYSWGEELPAQWTDIYNFIFRRRMVFLMQYLDDELCNQICGLLINIHMEDRSKELEKKEMERSGVFKSTGKSSKDKKTTSSGVTNFQDSASLGSKKSSGRSMEDLLNADEDLNIAENSKLEQYTLHKITTEWLNWNAQFFDYSDEPYLYYLAEILSKDFAKNETGQLLFNSTQHLKTSNPNSYNNVLKVYEPFRSVLNLASLISKDQNFNINNLLENNKNSFSISQSKELLKQFNQLNQKPGFNKLLNILASKEILNQNKNSQKQQEVATKMLGQRNLQKKYLDNTLQGPWSTPKKKKALNYLDFDSTGFTSKNGSQKNLNEYSRKQSKKNLQEEESKKVFVIINSFGGSVGNGITVHDSLQFIKAGTLTLGLGVAASAASLVLAGGTISERYVTEGCHVMLHQPEGGLNGQASDIWIDSQEIKKIRLDVAEIYSLSAHRPKHKILRDLDRDFYLNATEAISYGICDEIATNDTMSSIIQMTNMAWEYHDGKQQRLLESRTSVASNDTLAQS